MDILQRFAKALCQQGLLAEDAVPWLCYALRRRFFSCFCRLLLGALGWALAGPLEACCFLFSFFLLRRWGGGYHAKTPWQCLFLSAAQVWLSLGVLLPLLLAAPGFCSWLALLAAGGAIAATAPLLPFQLHATPAETAACRSRTRLVLALETAAALGLALWGARTWFLSVVLGIAGVAGSLLFEQFKRRTYYGKSETKIAAASGEDR